MSSQVPLFTPSGRGGASWTGNHTVTNWQGERTCWEIEASEVWTGQEGHLAELLNAKKAVLLRERRSESGLFHAGTPTSQLGMLPIATCSLPLILACRLSVILLAARNKTEP